MYRSNAILAPSTGSEVPHLVSSLRVTSNTPILSTRFQLVDLRLGFVAPVSRGRLHGGDGSLPVWMSLGWLAQAAASRSRENLAAGAAIALMPPPEIRVLSIADDLRTRVERCVLELNAVGE